MESFFIKLQAGQTKFYNIQVKTSKASYLNIVAAKAMELVSKFIGMTPIENWVFLLRKSINRTSVEQTDADYRSKE